MIIKEAKVHKRIVELEEKEEEEAKFLWPQKLMTE
jgi:hypothetical protein